MPRTAVALLAAASLLGLAACQGGVEVSSPRLSSQERAQCDALLEALPDELFGGERRDVDPEGAPAAAWGDPPVVLTCGVERPEEYDEFSACTPVGGSGWFMPPSQLEDRGAPIEVTAMSHSPLVQLVVPAEKRGSGPDSALRDLGPLVAEHLTETMPCH